MTQFASTLYPQTNPSNPILLRFRENQRRWNLDRLAQHWLWFLDSPLAEVCYLTEQRSHARRVLTRLASFSG